MSKQAGVSGCGGGCGPRDTSQDIVPARPVLERLSPTPAQAAKIMHDNGTYGDWVTDVPIQGPTDPGIRAADCWWKKNVIERAVTDHQGAMVPRWTQQSLCVGGRPCVGTAGVGETISRGGVRIGALAAAAPDPATTEDPNHPGISIAGYAAWLAKNKTTPPPGIWSKLSDVESVWVSTTLTQLNALILKAGNKPCATWPADLKAGAAAMTAAVACFQGWYTTNGKPGLRTDGTLDHATLCAILAVTQQHAADFPTPYPGKVFCLPVLSTPVKIGLGVAAVAAVGGTVAVLATRGKKRRAASHPG